MPHPCVRGLPRMWAEAMSMWLEDLRLMDAETLEDLCDEFEEKVNEGREELRRREEEEDA